MTCWAVMGRAHGVVLISAFISPAMAEESVVVTSSRLPEITHAVATQVIDAEEIRARNSGSLIELLRGQPGIALSQPGGAGGVSEVFLRGAESNFTLVMVDGVKVNDPTDSRGGTFDLASVSVDDVERIEIVRGPVSAVHGSEALAGVINVVTRTAATDDISAGIEAGSNGYSRFSARLANAAGERARVSLLAQYLDAGEPTPGSTLSSKSAQARLAYDFSSRIATTFGLRAAERSRTSFPDGSGGSGLAVLRDLEKSNASDTSLFANARFEVSQRWSLELAGSLFRRNDDLDTPAIAPGVTEGRPAQTAQARLRRSNFELSARYTPVEPLSVGFGIDAERASGRRDSLLDFGGFPLPSDFSLERHTNAAFVEGWWRAAKGLGIFASVRADLTNDADDSVSSRIGGTFESDSGLLRLHATWGEGFKLPSFYALGDGLIGNPSLAQERGTTLELGAELRPLAGGLTVGATAFRSVYRDLIDFDFATFGLVNRSRADIDGVDVSLRFDPGEALRMAISYSRAHADLASAGRLLNRPERMAAASVTWRPDARWLLSSLLSYVGDRAASSVPTGDVTLSAYARLDLAATYRFSERVDLRAAIVNLADENYQDNPGFPAPGRTLRIGVDARL